MTVSRPPFVPSRKLRNRAVHAVNGNTSPLSGKTSQKRLANSISNLRQNKKPKIVTPTSHSTPKPLTGSNLFNICREKSLTAIDAVWSPKPTPPPSPKPRSAKFKQISHSALIQLQQHANLSDSQLRKVLAFHRQETGRSDLYAPYFEKFLIATHKVFADEFSVSTYTPATPDDEPDAQPIPYVICQRPLNFLQKLEHLHNRKIRYECVDLCGCVWMCLMFHSVSTFPRVGCFQVLPSVCKCFQVFPSVSNCFQVFPSVSKQLVVLTQNELPL